MAAELQRRRSESLMSPSQVVRAFQQMSEESPQAATAAVPASTAAHPPHSVFEHAISCAALAAAGSPGLPSRLAASMPGAAPQVNGMPGARPASPGPEAGRRRSSGPGAVVPALALLAPVEGEEADTPSAAATRKRAALGQGCGFGSVLDRPGLQLEPAGPEGGAQAGGPGGAGEEGAGEGCWEVRDGSGDNTELLSRAASKNQVGQVLAAGQGWPSAELAAAAAGARVTAGPGAAPAPSSSVSHQPSQPPAWTPEGTGVAGRPRDSACAGPARVEAWRVGQAAGQRALSHTQTLLSEEQQARLQGQRQAASASGSPPAVPAPALPVVGSPQLLALPLGATGPTAAVARRLSGGPGPQGAFHPTQAFLRMLQPGSPLSQQQGGQPAQRAELLGTPANSGMALGGDSPAAPQTSSAPSVDPGLRAWARQGGGREGQGAGRPTSGLSAAAEVAMLAAVVADSPPGDRSPVTCQPLLLQPLEGEEGGLRGPEEGPASSRVTPGYPPGPFGHVSAPGQELQGQVPGAEAESEEEGGEQQAESQHQEGAPRGPCLPSQLLTHQAAGSSPMLAAVLSSGGLHPSRELSLALPPSQAARQQPPGSAQTMSPLPPPPGLGPGLQPPQALPLLPTQLGGPAQGPRLEGQPGLVSVRLGATTCLLHPAVLQQLASQGLVLSGPAPPPGPGALEEQVAESSGSVDQAGLKGAQGPGPGAPASSQALVSSEGAGCGVGPGAAPARLGRISSSFQFDLLHPRPDCPPGEDATRPLPAGPGPSPWLLGSRSPSPQLPGCSPIGAELLRPPPLQQLLMLAPQDVLRLSPGPTPPDGQAAPPAAAAAAPPLLTGRWGQPHMMYSSAALTGEGADAGQQVHVLHQPPTHTGLEPGPPAPAASSLSNGARADTEPGSSMTDEEAAEALTHLGDKEEGGRRGPGRRARGGPAGCTARSSSPPPAPASLGLLPPSSPRQGHEQKGRGLGGQAGGARQQPGGEGAGHASGQQPASHWQPGSPLASPPAAHPAREGTEALSPGPAHGPPPSPSPLAALPPRELQWLEALTTTTRFFQPCAGCDPLLTPAERVANGGRDALATLMDLDDPDGEGVCAHCRPARTALRHRLLQVRRSTYHDVVKAADLVALGVDLQGVQSYSINNAKVVFLKPRPTRTAPKGGSSMPARCVLDGRQLMDPTSCYCCLRCKMEVELHGVAPLMSSDTRDEEGAAASPRASSGLNPAGGARAGLSSPTGGTLRGALKEGRDPTTPQTGYGRAGGEGGAGEGSSPLAAPRKRLRGASAPTLPSLPPSPGWLSLGGGLDRPPLGLASLQEGGREAAAVSPGPPYQRPAPHPGQQQQAGYGQQLVHPQAALHQQLQLTGYPAQQAAAWLQASGHPGLMQPGPWWLTAPGGLDQAGGAGGAARWPQALPPHSTVPLEFAQPPAAFPPGWGVQGTPGPGATAAGERAPASPYSPAAAPAASRAGTAQLAGPAGSGIQRVSDSSSRETQVSAAPPGTPQAVRGMAPAAPHEQAAAAAAPDGEGQGQAAQLGVGGAGGAAGGAAGGPAGGAAGPEGAAGEEGEAPLDLFHTTPLTRQLKARERQHQQGGQEGGQAHSQSPTPGQAGRMHRAGSGADQQPPAGGQAGYGSAAAPPLPHHQPTLPSPPRQPHPHPHPHLQHQHYPTAGYTGQLPRQQQAPHPSSPLPPQPQPRGPPGQHTPPGTPPHSSALQQPGTSPARPHSTPGLSGEGGHTASHDTRSTASMRRKAVPVKRANLD